MGSLYDSLLSLNAMEGAREDWAEYRGALTAFILDRAKKGGSCLIAGAGACNDLDLAQLSAHFSSVTLLDTDTAAMQSALDRCPAENVRLLRADFLGVPEEDYRAFDGEMQAGIRAGTGGDKLTKLFLERMERLLLVARPDLLPRADTVVCCGVHSQLLAMFARMAGVYARYTALDLKRIYQRISLFNGQLQPAFNARLLEAAESELILGLETGRPGVPGGIEGAAQALLDLASRGLAACTAELEWPFDITRQKQYTVKVICVNKR